MRYQIMLIALLIGCGGDSDECIVKEGTYRETRTLVHSCDESKEGNVYDSEAYIDKQFCGVSEKNPTDVKGECIGEIEFIRYHKEETYTGQMELELTCPGKGTCTSLLDIKGEYID